MLKDYPKFYRGELLKFKSKISSKNKKILESFLKECSTSAGEGKIKKIERVILQFMFITKVDLDKIKKETVDSFITLLKNSYRTEWSKNEIKVYLKKFLIWKYKRTNLVKNIKLNSKPFNEKRVNEGVLFTKEEIKKLIRAAETLRWKAWIMLMFESGARPQEVQNLKWGEVKFVGDGITDISLFSGKTRSSRVFPLKESTIHLKRWKQEYCFPNIKDDDYVFPNPNHRDRPLGVESFNKHLKSIAERAGIERNVFTYLFRHTKSHELYDKLPQSKVEKLMGHTGMIGIYAHMSNKKAREAVINEIYHIEELTEQEREEIKELRERLRKVEKIVYEREGNVFVKEK